MTENPDDREWQYVLTDTLTMLIVMAVIAWLCSACTAAPTEPVAPPTPPKPGVCFGPPPCVSL